MPIGKVLISVIILAGLLAVAVALTCAHPKGETMALYETWIITKTSVSPPVSHSYHNLLTGLNANQPNIQEQPLPTYEIAWESNPPGHGEYVIKYGLEGYLNPQESPQMIRWYSEEPPGQNREPFYSQDALFSYIQERDAFWHE